jgi:Melibiase
MVLGQTTARLETADTVLQLQAGPAAPQVVAISSPRQIPWVNTSVEPLIDSALIDDRPVALHWQLDPTASSVGPRHVRFVYNSESPRLRLSWKWQARAAFGPLEHEIQIENLDHRKVWLSLQPSFQFSWKIHSGKKVEQLYVEKGANTPSEVGTHLAQVAAGYKWRGISSTYAHPKENEAREIIPWFLVEETSSSKNGWYIGIEFSGRTELRLQRDSDSLTGVAGLNPDPGPFRTRLAPGESFDAPPIFLGASQDAGWFRGVGDWYPNPQSFPHGMEAIADDAHQHRMKFGLWVDWTQAAFDAEPGALNARDPKVRDWMVTDLPPDWKPEDFKGQTIDIGVPEAKDWAQREVERIVSDYHLDMLEHDGYLIAQGCERNDHPHAPPDNWNKCIYKAWGSYWVDSSNSTDVSYHAVHAYYDIYTQLRKDHPGILLEVCNDGGRMIDFGSAAHADYFSITDTYDPLSNRRAFYDASHVLPSAMLESYVEKWPQPRPENFLYMLRSGMMGWLTIMMDTTAWKDEQHAIAKKEFELYKSQLRPLIRDADLYHFSPRPDGKRWDGMQYFDRLTRRGVVYAFRGTTKSESTHGFVLKGLRSDARYHLHFHDHSSPDRTVTGRELLTTGLLVSLPQAESSELIFFEEQK